MAPYVPFKPLPWRLVWCPGEVRFRHVHKESQTQGRLYVLWTHDRLVWLGQSLKVLMEFARQYYGILLHVSSGYRIIRRLQTQGHKGFAVCRPADALELNELLERVQPLWIGTALRDPDKWETMVEAVVQSVDDCSGSEGPNTCEKSTHTLSC